MKRNDPNPLQALEAIQMLWDRDEPAQYKAILTDMFEGWLGCHLSDGCDANQRLTVYHCYESLTEFFDKLEAATAGKA